ncbi:MAG: arginine--tRNA ligase [Phycisphaerales bacterium]|nr:arginine--tRNA ligase [Phycisphaerales bacterium]
MPDARDDATLDTFDPVEVLADRFRAAILGALPGTDPDVDPMIAPSKRAELGDFQCNAAMPLAKAAGRPPREIAAAIVRHADLGGLAEPLTERDVAGPGFINVRLRPAAIASLLARLDTPDLGIPPTATPRTVVVDLCGVNLAKQMHVGHLRSTVIGDALARAFERLGERVIRQNHVGDWGLPIAMVTDRLRREAEGGRIDLDRVTLDDLDRLYRDAQRECAGQARAIEIVQRYRMGPKAEAELRAEHEEAEERLAAAKRTLVALQSRDPATVAVWRRIYDVTMRACLDTCERLHTRITAGDSAGESSYAEELGPLVDDLVNRAVAVESDGALVVRLEHEGIAEPCIVRKRDGGYLYATTDLAGIRRRVHGLGADRVVYAVDARQSLHFRQVFAAARKASYATRPGASGPALLEHAPFGMVLGEDNRPFKTRTGENVKLSDLLDEAEARAERTVAEKNPDLGHDERRAIAHAVAIAALKYTDLSTERIKDYVFSFDRMLAFEGNTGPYLLYALVRIRSIFRKAAERGIALDHRDAPFAAEHPAEKALALTLLRYPRTVHAVGDALEPHRLCAFLYDLAGAFSAFFDACPVLAADDDATRRSRLRLCDLTARVLADGLDVLGIPAVERM